MHSQVAKSRNGELRELFVSGFGIHHAGMLRPDRTLVERAFSAGAMRVLICTATLAWGVNLPAHSVVIKGTDIYDPQKGGHVDLSILDVMQVLPNRCFACALAPSHLPSSSLLFCFGLFVCESDLWARWSTAVRQQWRGHTYHLPQVPAELPAHDQQTVAN